MCFVSRAARIARAARETKHIQRMLFDRMSDQITSAECALFRGLPWQFALPAKQSTFSGCYLIGHAILPSPLKTPRVRGNRGAFSLIRYLEMPPRRLGWVRRV